MNTYALTYRNKSLSLSTGAPVDALVSMLRPGVEVEIPAQTVTVPGEEHKPARRPRKPRAAAPAAKKRTRKPAAATKPAREPKASKASADDLKASVLAIVRGAGDKGAAMKDMATTGAKPPAVRRVLDSLKKAGELRSEGVRRSTRYYAAAA